MALSAEVAERVMGEPAPPVLEGEENDHSFSVYLTGEPIKFPKGAWRCHWIFDHGDVPEWHPAPFAESIAQAFKAEDRIAELNLKGAYASALCRIVVADMKDGDIESGQWLLAHASPEQRCRAALQCVKEKAKAASG